MRKIDISPKAYNDLEDIKEYLDSEYPIGNTYDI